MGTLGRRFIAWRRSVMFLVVVLATAFGLLPSMAQASSSGEVAALLHEIRSLSERALAAANAASEAATIAEVKAGADSVYRIMWGIPSGLAEDGANGAEVAHGWKERWQTDESHFDSAYAARYSGLPPRITDPRDLGLIGRGRYVRRLLDTLIADSSAPPDQRMHADHVRIALNNVIGWMQMDTGRIKNEIQPRVDLTRVWDAPVSFWNSTSDTGWAFEALAQALNILKVRYDDVGEAREHARAMADLVQAYIDGHDANGDGQIGPVMMEGGLTTALQHAELAGFRLP